MRLMQILLGAVAATALVSTAFAADLPTRKAPMAPYPAPQAYTFSWTGPYIGAFAGGNWARTRSSDTTFPGFGGGPDLTSNGLTAGGLAGWNWGFNGFLIGGEVEAGYNHRSASANFAAGPFGAPSSISDFGSAEGRARGRLGFGWDRFMLFAAGGGTVVDQRISIGSPFGTQEMTRWRGGWNVGGGLEWAFSDHWIVRGEYIYDRFGSRGYDFAGQNANFDSRSIRLEQSTARAAIAYKF